MLTIFSIIEERSSALSLCYYCFVEFENATATALEQVSGNADGEAGGWVLHFSPPIGVLLIALCAKYILYEGA
jgi:hypothetical protein